MGGVLKERRLGYSLGKVWGKREGGERGEALPA